MSTRDRLNEPKYGFNRPDAVATDGIRVWVTNQDGDSVTELDAATGALVKVLSKPGYGFFSPYAVSSDGTRGLGDQPKR